MPRRSTVSLDDVAALDNLARAFGEAAAGKRTRPEVQRFAVPLEAQLAELRQDILAGRAPDGRYCEFRVFDPKPRRVLAPAFRDRVLHHALMGVMAPVLDRALVADTFACRPGKGSLAAVLWARQHSRRFPWYVKADIRAYFAHVDHAVLRALLARRFKDPRLLALCARILERTPDGPGRGLPIGALTSQHFANTYLDGLDRFLLEQLRVPAYVRYMDDFVWWCPSRDAARASLRAVRDYVARERRLEVKDGAIIQRSDRGLPFLGFRIGPRAFRLSRRRRRRYRAARERWEGAFAAGLISAPTLQAGYAAARAITAHADAAAWRRAELARQPALDA